MAVFSLGECRHNLGGAEKIAPDPIPLPFRFDVGLNRDHVLKSCTLGVTHHEVECDV